MKVFIIISLFFFVFTANLHAGPIKALLTPFVKTVPKLMDEVPDISSNKVIPKNVLDNFSTEEASSYVNKFAPENSLDDILSDDFSKTFVDDTKDIFKSSETEKTANSNSEIKSKIALPTAGGFAYSKNRNEKEKKEQDVSKSSKKVK